MEGVFRGVSLLLLVFLCVVLHELGHALAARHYGIKTRDITLLPIGGVARLERMPKKPSQEFWVAVAGPAVNVVIALALFAGIYVGGKLAPMENVIQARGTFLEQLLAINVWIVMFNLLPSFPMDGGRVLRAILASRMPYAKATRIAATVGQFMALIFAFLGFTIPNLLLILIALFVWVSASQESRAAQIQAGLEDILVRDTMMTEFHALRIDDTLAAAVTLTLAGSQHDFPVLDQQTFKGMLTRKSLMETLASQGNQTPVAQAMTREVPVLDADLPVQEAISALQSSNCETIPVFDKTRLVGLLTSENVGEFLLIRSSLKPGRDTGFIRRDP
jgi:Zn-dependent protease